MLAVVLELMFVLARASCKLPRKSVKIRLIGAEVLTLTVTGSCGENQVLLGTRSVRSINVVATACIFSITSGTIVRDFQHGGTENTEKPKCKILSPCSPCLRVA